MLVGVTSKSTYTASCHTKKFQRTKAQFVWFALHLLWLLCLFPSNICATSEKPVISGTTVSHRLFQKALDGEYLPHDLFFLFHTLFVSIYHKNKHTSPKIGVCMYIFDFMTKKLSLFTPLTIILNNNLHTITEHLRDTNT